ncbi:hypothetical protein HGRIS_012942 [Hohenbuehelia grisea]|uniref:Cupredoxin n=1 Tax=Hohenbuehelia grisea TaxID=104357 RepID=A0ABR3ITW9_9AGAR
MRATFAVAVSALALGVTAENITVKVGDGGLLFNPTQVTAKIGDTIAFQFVAKNHSVTQSTFANPCQVMTTPNPGIDSGFQAVAAGATTFPQWSFTVNNDSAPLWFFCAQTAPVNHCQMGMVFAVNPTAEKSFDAFKANAASAATNTTSAGTPGSPTSSGSAASASASNAAVSVRGTSAGVLALAGLAAGLWL